MQREDEERRVKRMQAAEEGRRKEEACRACRQRVQAEGTVHEGKCRGGMERMQAACMRGYTWMTMTEGIGEEGKGGRTRKEEEGQNHRRGWMASSEESMYGQEAGNGHRAEGA